MIEEYRLGLIGYPLSHSLSPLIHRAALRALDLPGVYELYAIPPLPAGRAELVDLLQGVRRGEIHGLNITIPHKQSVLDLVDDLTPTARVIGAVNTLLLQDDRLVGENTDASGFLADLAHNLATEGAEQHGSTVEWLVWEAGLNRTALVLGAGGSARAVVYALLIAGFDLIIAARRIEQARQLVADFSALEDAGGLVSAQERLSAISLDGESLTAQIANAASPIGLIVNSTPVGMFPNIDASPWPGETSFPDGAVIYDLIYNPGETLLLRLARQAGQRAFNGLGMLVEQAALAFELWTGREAPRDAMRQAVKL